MVNGRNALGRSFLFWTFLVATLLAGCAPPPHLQPEINSLLVAKRWSMAADKIEAKEADYGQGNYLLYYLDRGLLEQMTGRFASSIKSFEKAKARFNKLYTQSISDEVGSWLTNDYTLPYRGSDYEYVLVNVFQALNFIQLEDINEALVEARDLDAKFRVVEEVAANSKREHFEDNGFARMFMGIIYEAAGAPQDLNDAWIAYRQALALYDGYYGGSYVPTVLQERLLALAARFGDPDLDRFRRRFPEASRSADAREEGQAVVFLVHSIGFAPLKVPEIIPIPIEREFITQIAFPMFAKRYYDIRSSRLVAEGQGVALALATELGADIEDIAIRDLKSRRALILSKAVMRPALKYFIERKQKENIEKEYGRGAAEAFGVFSNLYNLYSEQADLRSWQALPAQIRIARIVLKPGQYRFKLDNMTEDGAVAGSEDLGMVDLRPDETRFIIRRSDH
jgi:hypothetical protein